MDVPINEVDPNSSIILVQMKTGSDRLRNYDARGTFLSGNLIRLELSDAYNHISSWLSWQVIEFHNVKSKQEGIYFFSAGGYGANDSFADIPINTVDPTKCLLITTYVLNYAGGGLNEFIRSVPYTCHLKDENTLTASAYSLYSGMQWQLLEFN